MFDCYSSRHKARRSVTTAKKPLRNLARGKGNVEPE
jgi:hypothetical protein